MSRIADFEVDGYRVKEGPTGGWSVSVPNGKPEPAEPISRHETSSEARAAAKRYAAGDKRRSSR